MTNDHSTIASPDHIDLSAPIWTIEHLAAAFGVAVDTAREYSYHADFPAPKALFARNLWARTEVLAWFDRLPARDHTTTQRTRRTTARPATRAAAGPASGRPAGQQGLKPYQPRTAR